MRDIDSIGLDSSSFQAKVFEESIDNTLCSSPIFIRRYMNSDFAYRLDKSGLLIEPTMPSDVFRELDEEYNKSTYGKEKYTYEEMYWIGYIYRYWAYTYKLTSKHLYKLIKPSELRDVYYPYHSLDPKMAIERICEAKNIILDDVKRGVLFLKSLYRSENNF